jgi:hypothetical protein
MLKQFDPGAQERQRELDAAALRLRIDEELSFAELAKRLDVNEETARRRVRRAEQRALRELAHEKAAALQKHTLRLERLLRRGWQDYENDPSPKRYELLLKTLTEFRKTWGLGLGEGNAVPTGPTIIAQQANFAPVNLNLLNEARARLGRPPLPLAQERQAEAVGQPSAPPAGDAP